MEKKLLLITITLITITSLNTTPASAQEKITVTASPSAEQSLNEKLNKQINQLKERIASRVAELNLVEKRGVIGIVSETSNNKITINDLNGKTRYIDVDEFTKFSSPSAKSSFGLSDLAKGTKISVLGLYNKQSKQILARFIEAYTIPIFLAGNISNIDKKNYTITVIDENKKENIIDIQTFTNISIYLKEDGVSKFGFSKLKIGDKLTAIGFPDKKDSSLLQTTRILVLPELPKNSKIIVPEPTTEITPSPSGSQVATPSPSASKKSTPTPTP